MKKLLLDTHTLIWFFEDDSRLPIIVKNMIENADNKVFVSIVSFWEIAIKKSLGKLTLAKDLPSMFRECKNLDIEVLGVSISEVEAVEVLPLHHRDPFDRILIATTLTNSLEILSNDTQFDNYPIRRIW